MRQPVALLLAVGPLAPPTAAAPAGRLATVPGTCAFTRVQQATQRLEDGAHHEVAGSGSAVVLADGVNGVSYDEVPAVNRSRRGDPVTACLARLPRRCPPGDRRGKWYTVTNLRTNEAWTLSDAEHGCGSA